MGPLQALPSGRATRSGGPPLRSTGGCLGGGPPLSPGGDIDGVLGGLTEGFAFFSFPLSTCSFFLSLSSFVGLDLLDELLLLLRCDLLLLDLSRFLVLLLLLLGVLSSLSCFDPLENLPSSTGEATSSTPGVSLGVLGLSPSFFGAIQLLSGRSASDSLLPLVGVSPRTTGLADFEAAVAVAAARAFSASPNLSSSS